MERETVYIGTEIKLNINIQPIRDITMDNYDFNLEVSSPYSANPVIVEKKDMVRVDENNYIAIIDTSLLGKGEIKSVLTAYVPDSDMPDGKRTEVISQQTGILLSTK